MSANPVITESTRAFVRRVEGGAALLTLAALALTHAFAGFGPMFAGVLAGGVIATLNWRLIVVLAQRTAEGERRSRLFYTMMSGFKLALLLTAIGAVLYLLPVSPLGFVIGMTNLFISIAFVGLLQRPTRTVKAVGHTTEERGA